MQDPLSLLESDGYPLPAFHFKVLFAFTIGNADTSFQSVSGLSTTMELEELREGGENELVHYLPKKITHTNLKLKRGISTWNSPLFQWMQSVFQSNFRLPIAPMPLQIHLLDSKAIPKRVWHINDALPVSWDFDEFGSTKNDVAIETLEMKYTSLYRLF